MDVYKGIGVMSGTSLDGLDIAYCIFIYDDGWSYQIEKAVTVPYDDVLKMKLHSVSRMHAEDFVKADVEFGRFIGHHVAKFINENQFVPDFIASHGHTIFHQPLNKFTCQIGNGHTIYGLLRIPVIYNFRSLDVALGGQGAPLVPIGDKLLFKEYDYCLNLGGIANISYEIDNQRVAWDICPVNQVLNQIALKLGKDYDEGGVLASQGVVNKSLFAALNSLGYYFQNPPKSLGKEWVESSFMPVLNNFDVPWIDKLTTCSEHEAFQIAKSTKQINGRRMLVTGGGAFNNFLVDRIREYTSLDVTIPDDVLINYKEAMIFAFLGLLRLRGEINCLSSVTGALKDSSSGLIVQ